MKDDVFYRDEARSLALRLCREEDVPRLAELERICFADPWSVNMLMEEFRHPRGVYLLAVLEDEVQGYAGMWVWDILGEAHVSNVAVAPAYRQHGLGRLLMLGLMVLAEIGGADSMTLEVREGNRAAQRLYQALDFTSSGKRPHYYANGEDALIMWNDDIAATLQKYIGADENYAKMYEDMYKSLRPRPEA